MTEEQTRPHRGVILIARKMWQDALGFLWNPGKGKINNRKKSAASVQQPSSLTQAEDVSDEVMAATVAGLSRGTRKPNDSEVLAALATKRAAEEANEGALGEDHPMAEDVVVNDAEQDQIELAPPEFVSSSAEEAVRENAGEVDPPQDSGTAEHQCEV